MTPHIKSYLELRIILPVVMELQFEMPLLPECLIQKEAV